MMFKLGLGLALLLVLQSCDFASVDHRTADFPFSDPNRPDSEVFDSLYRVTLQRQNPLSSLENVEATIRYSKKIKDSVNLAKAYYLIGYQYHISKDFDAAKVFFAKAMESYQNLGYWPEIMYINKIFARIYRQQGRVYEIEECLQVAMERLQDAKVESFAELMPIHELAVHYNYDLENHKEAVAYGELFFKRLAHFDSLQPQHPLFAKIVAQETDVIDLILGVSYTNLGQQDKAYSYLTKALRSYSKRNDTEKLSRVHKAFIEHYIKTGDANKLIYHKDEFYKAMLKFMTELGNSEKDINQLKLKLLDEKRELAMLKEESKLKTFYIYASIAATLVLVFFQWYSTKLVREKREVALQLNKQYDFDRFKTNVLITVAHELRTPLTIILGHLQLIADKKIKPEDFNLYFNKIKKSSQGILNKMSEIINLLKEDSTKSELNKEEIIVQPFLKGLFFGFEGVARIKKIQLVFNSRLPNGHRIHTDPTMLSGILNNLIVNAIKFSSAESKIKMDVAYDGKKLEIQVIDNGVGISEENQKLIFDKFSRLSTAAFIDGFGIGLAIVKQSTEQLGGTIDVQSSLGKGSTFKLTLPNETIMVAEEERSELRLESEAYDAVASTKQTVKNKFPSLLIVEDNPEMSAFYNHIFSPAFDCTFCFNGQEGLDALNRKEFDLIVSDVMMPIMDGFEFKEQVRSNPSFKQIPFVLVTAKDKGESKVRAFNIGVDDYIVKPFNKDELMARIQSLISNKKAREKWFLGNTDNRALEVDNFDEKTVKKLQDIVLKNCEQEDFSVQDLAKEIGQSQRQLGRVIKKLTGLTPVKFILEVRLLEAYKKIKNREEADINNVRFSVGIQSASYFSTQFKKRFGINPTELVKYRKSTLVNLEENPLKR